MTHKSARKAALLNLIPLPIAFGYEYLGLQYRYWTHSFTRAAAIIIGFGVSALVKIDCSAGQGCTGDDELWAFAGLLGVPAVVIFLSSVDA
jgi:hypothetical protein